MGPKSNQPQANAKSKVVDVDTKSTKVVNEDSKPQENSGFDIGKIFLLIFFSIVFLGAIHMYFEKLAQNIKDENYAYQEKLKKYKSKYDELVNFNIKQNSENEANQVHDYTKENDDAISTLKSKVKELRQQVNSLESKYDAVVNEIISGHIENLKKEIQTRQEEANNNYLKELKALKKQEKAKLENVQFKYYYKYNSTERELFNHYLKPYNGNNPSIWSIFYELQQNTTTQYTNFDKSEQQNKVLDNAEISLKKAISQWDSFTTQKSVEVEKLKEEIASNTPIDKKSTAVDLLKGLREIKTKAKSHLLEILSNSFDFKDYYNHLYKAFGEKNFNFRLLFNSNKFDTFEDLKNDLVKIAGQEHLLFYAQTNDDRLVGGYLNAPFPKFEVSLEEIFIDDSSSFIFEFKAKDNYAQVFPAIKFARVHFSCRYMNKSTLYFGFGNIKNDEGLTFNFKEPDNHDPQMAYASYGKRPVAFDINDDKTQFNYDQFASPPHKIKGVKIYKIDFLE